MGERLQKKSSFEQNPKVELAKRIKQTALQRDKVTENLFVQITDGQDPRKFIKKACKLAGITLPKDRESLAYHVYLLQEFLDYPKEDNARGCDGKLGPYTYSGLIKKYPQLNVRTRQPVLRNSRTQRKRLISDSRLPTPSLFLRPKKDVERKPINVQSVAYYGDSLTQQYTKYAMSRREFQSRKNKDYKIGRWARTMRKKMERNLNYYSRKKAIVIGAGTNDLKYRSANAIFGDLEAMYTMLLKRNPNIQIVALTLLPYPGNEIRNRKIRAINNKIRVFASRFSKNIRIIDLHKTFEWAIKKYGRKRVLYRDRIHMNPKVAKAVAGMIKDSLRTGTYRDINEYLS